MNNLTTRLRTAMIIMVGLCISTIGTSFAQTPFPCDGRFYLSEHSTSVPTNFHEFEAGDPVNLLPLASGPFSLNGMAFRKTDRYIYSIDPVSKLIARIDAAGQITNMGVVSNLPNGIYEAATMDPFGRMIVVSRNGSSNRIATLNLNSIPISIFNSSTLNYNNGSPVPPEFGDIAMHPATGVIYGFDEVTHKLASITANTGIVTPIGNAQNQIESINAMYFNAFGQLFAYGRYTTDTSDNRYFSVDLSSGTLTEIASGPSLNNIDGCSCAFTVDISKTYSVDTANAGQVVTLTYKIANRSGAQLTGVSLNDQIDAGRIFTGTLSGTLGGTLSGGTGPGTNSLEITNMTIPVGQHTITIDVQLPAGGSQSQFFYDQAILGGLPSTLGSQRLSDEPRLPGQSDSSYIIVFVEEICGDGIDNDGNGFVDCPTPEFTVDDTLCLGSDITITNTTVGAITYTWDLCSGNLGEVPTTTNLGNQQLDRPGFLKTIEHNDEYFTFITNSPGTQNGKVVRLDHGSDMSAIPTPNNLNIPGLLQAYVRGIDIVESNGNWFGFLVTGSGTNSTLIRLNFGPNPANNTPTATDLGNFSILNDAFDLQITSEGGTWYGLIVNRSSNSLTHLNFGANPANMPTVTDLGNIGSLDQPSGLYIVEEDANWCAFVTNSGSNASITRIEFGNSMGNAPLTATNLGNMGVFGVNNRLPRDMSIKNDCNNVYGFVVNSGTDDIVRLEFAESVNNTPNAVILNGSTFSAPLGISNVIRKGGELFSFVTNNSNSSISRLFFPSCNNSSIPNSNNFQPGAFQFLTTGTYTINLLIDAGLSTEASVCKTVTVIDSTEVIMTPADVTCAGGNDGSISINVSGGQLPYTYSWSNGANSANIQNLDADIYTLTLLDGSGCISKTSVAINEPAPIQTNASLTHLQCNGQTNGAIDLTVSGGQGGFTYNWSDGSTSQDRTNLNAGTFYVTVTDVSSCVTVDTFVLTQPSGITINPLTTQITCNGANDGAIDLNVTGTNPPFTYSWSNGSTNSQEINLSSGTYDITVSDSLGCSAITSIVLNDPQAISSQLTVTDVSCANASDGAIDQLVSGGTSPYTFIWSDGNSSEDRSNLSGGTFDLTITDANNCTAQFTTILNEPSPIQINLQVTDEACGNAAGAINAVVSGGNGGFSYNWSTGDTSNSINGLTSGTYNLIVNDINGCSESTNAHIANLNGPGITANITDASCFGYTDGSIQLQINGGAAPYTYAWSNGATSASINSIGAGSFNVTVTDDNGCSGVQNIQVAEPSALIIESITDEPTCFGDADGSIDVSVSGGTQPYDLAWNTGDQGYSLNNISSGNYTLTVTDQSGCAQPYTVVMNDPAPVSISTTPSVYSLLLGESAALSTLVLSNSEVQYSWTPDFMLDLTDPSAPIANPNTSTTYTVTIKDDIGCTDSDTVRVNIIPFKPVYVPNAFSPNGDGKNDIFQVKTSGIYQMRLQIFDRWGNKMFETSDPTQGWDGTYKGKPVNQDVYIYDLSIVFLDRKSRKEHGSITLLR